MKKYLFITSYLCVIKEYNRILLFSNSGKRHSHLINKTTLVDDVIVKRRILSRRANKRRHKYAEESVSLLVAEAAASRDFIDEDCSTKS